jgi:hypothetical protein
MMSVAANDKWHNAGKPEPIPSRHGRLRKFHVRRYWFVPLLQTATGFAKAEKGRTLACEALGNAQDVRFF